MKYLTILTCIFFFTIISCALKTDSIEILKKYQREEFKVKDTVMLKGFIIFNEQSVSQFYKVDSANITDTINYVKKLKRSKSSYLFIQPFDAKKYNIYINYCSSSALDSQFFIKRIRHTKKIVYMFCNEEEFILLQNENYRNYLSFKCWKPYVKRSLD